MPQFLRTRAGVVAAFIAGLVIATAGTATAAKLITGKQIKDGTISAKDLSKAVRQQLTKTGAAGAAGPQGPAGSKGEAGAPGVKGDAGTQGLPGIQGIPGDKGDQGLQGIQGVPGDKGDQGLQGIQGIPGNKGDTGATGPSDVYEKTVIPANPVAIGVGFTQIAQIGFAPPVALDARGVVTVLMGGTTGTVSCQLGVGPFGGGTAATMIQTIPAGTYGSIAVEKSYGWSAGNNGAATLFCMSSQAASVTNAVLSVTKVGSYTPS